MNKNQESMNFEVDIDNNDDCLSLHERVKLEKTDTLITRK